MESKIIEVNATCDISSSDFDLSSMAIPSHKILN